MRFIDGAGFEGLVRELVTRGYVVIGPVLRDGAIRLEPITDPSELVSGVGDRQEAGRYEVSQADGERRRFSLSNGPDSAKRFLFPARETTTDLSRGDGRIRIEERALDQPRYAFVGLRSCDLHAIALQDHVFLEGPVADQPYELRRSSAFLIGVDCAEPGGTCFCASTGTGPACTQGFDLALTEVSSGFVVRTGSTAGEELVASIGFRQATVREETEAERVRASAEGKMGRSHDVEGVSDLLVRNRTHPRWAAIAERCLACGNCTAVCPTCFCHDVVDTVALGGDRTARTREWASCFSREFSHVAGGPVRRSGAARYRQWLTHKFSSWVDQFGTLGCVGCGRCISWCPAGIDLMAEIEEIRRTDGLVEAEA
jgi:sulfhydrogenase subunit beta (sulfur reductase)